MGIGLPGFFSHVLPPVRCVLCDIVAARSICAECLNDLPLIETACRRCARPLIDTAEHCGGCLAAPPVQDATVAACHYRFPADELVAALKFRGHRRSAEAMAEALLRRLTEADIVPDCYVPVPLHRWRAWRRGYNQAERLARALGALHRRPVLEVLRRTRATRPQVHLSRDRRQTNVAGAFRAVTTDPLPIHVGLVDDVLTTGATMNAAATALAVRGPSRITAIAFARAC